MCTLNNSLNLRSKVNLINLNILNSNFLYIKVNREKQGYIDFIY
jgi:hypothetical protein